MINDFELTENNENALRSRVPCDRVQRHSLGGADLSAPHLTLQSKGDVADAVLPFVLIPSKRDGDIQAPAELVRFRLHASIPSALPGLAALRHRRGSPAFPSVDLPVHSEAGTAKFPERKKCPPLARPCGDGGSGQGHRHHDRFCGP